MCSIAITEQLRHREAQIEALTAYIRDPQWFSVRNHDNDDVTAAKHDTSQHRRWHGRASADNCGDGSGPKRPRAESEHYDTVSGVSSCDDVGSRDGRPEILVPRTEEVDDSHSQRKVSHALPCSRGVTSVTADRQV